MLKPLRIVFIAIYIIILLLFTIGYAALPIINASQNSTNIGSTIPNTADTSFSTASNIIISTLKFYIDRYTQDGSTIKYSTLGGTAASFLQTLLYICITATILITAGIICSYLGLKFISSILYYFALTAMSIIILLLIIIKSTNIISNAIANYGFNININTDNINYDAGFTIMTVSTCIMFVSNILYGFIG